MKYAEEAGVLWRTYVPPRGQADTIQGELIRSIEKLRDEAQRNGNVNWAEGHVILAVYVRDQLVRSGLADAEAIAEINADTARLLDFDQPETSDVPYDELTDKIVLWARAHPDPISRQANSDLHI